MAEIPVERKTGGGGLPSWLPLLLLLLLIPLLFFLWRSCTPAPVVSNTNGNGNYNANRAVTTNANSSGAMTTTNSTGTTTNAGNANTSTISVDNKGTATGARVTDVNLFGSTTDKLSLVGRGVGLTNVKVNQVLSDRVFTVTSGSGEMFMMLDEKLDSGGGKEKQIKMRPGQIVNLGGNFRAVPNAETQDEKNRDLSSKEYAQMKGQQIYLQVESVEDAK